ncbi:MULTISPECIES: hypothetical protein [Clostridia]|uniref:hypothetical protein n=1 Tax=Clostridia TaxID=186801 RepID=UPI000E4E65C7|nr:MULTISPECIES: hypothetical protein [Clostridia]RGH39921.1 hypothetical protein DW901_06565 [Firmicutes bacterium AM41-5BH]RHV07625.1 hypothetical protein DXB97_03005 [Firmicutes bacterium OM07-11]RKQ28509.1 hypothetical protein D8Q48_09205 [Ruminococcus sp. B05]TAP32466.1 hypothetical protein EYA86_10240 [Mediterraneibacter sp. gm002]
MQEAQVTRDGNILTIGKDIQLIVNLDNQQNYVKYDSRKVPYQREIVFGKDLLEGKRQNVFRTAINYYYEQACRFVEGLQIAENYQKTINTTVREIK